MGLYDFEIVQEGVTGAVARRFAIADPMGLWLRIGIIAESLPKSNSFIKVTDDMGDIVAFVGVATATYLCTAKLLANLNSFS
jgi:hypothetical protein